MKKIIPKSPIAIPFQRGVSSSEKLSMTDINRFPHLLEILQELAIAFKLLKIQEPTMMLVGPGVIKIGFNGINAYTSPQLFEVASIFPNAQLTIVEPNPTGSKILEEGQFAWGEIPHYKSFMSHNEINPLKHPHLKAGIDAIIRYNEHPEMLNCLRSREMMNTTLENLPARFNKSQMLIIATFSTLYSLLKIVKNSKTNQERKNKIDAYIRKIMGFLKGNGKLIIDDNTFNVLCLFCPLGTPKERYLKETYPDLIKEVKIIQPEYLTPVPYTKVEDDIRGTVCTVKGYDQTDLKVEDIITNPIVVITKQPYKKTK